MPKNLQDALDQEVHARSQCLGPAVVRVDVEQPRAADSSGRAGPLNVERFGLGKAAAVETASPRPKSPHYDQVSLVVQAVVHDALTGHQTPESAVRRLARELAAISQR